MDFPNYYTSAKRVITLVERLRDGNRRKAVDQRTGQYYDYLYPSPDKYRWQWFWDSCFHAIVMAYVDQQAAVAELRTLAKGQEANGFIGHVSFWGGRLWGDAPGRLKHPFAWRSRHSALIHPPLLAQAVERVTEIVGDPWVAAEFLPVLDMYHQWLFRYRSAEDGLLLIFSPLESGLNRAPVFDQALGCSESPSYWKLAIREGWIDFRNALVNYGSERLSQSGAFKVKDVLVNSLYADSLSTMSRLHLRHGDRTSADEYTKLAARVVNSMVTKMWDRSRGAFFDLYGAPERRSTPLTIGSIVPILVPELPEEVVHMMVEQHLESPIRFSAEFPVPSVALSEPTFNPNSGRSGWRGSTSLKTNWLLWRGLHRHGLTTLATRLAERTAAMVAKAGLREFYHPISGQGLGGREFASSGLVLDMGDD